MRQQRLAVRTSARVRPGLPASGDLLWIDYRASPQFRVNPIMLCVIRVDRRTTYTGWCWLIGYELFLTGRPRRRREIFVRIDGLREPPPTLDERRALVAHPAPPMTVGVSRGLPDPG